MQEMQVQSLGREDNLKEERAAHANILAWRGLWTEEPGGLQSIGSQSRTRLNYWARHQAEKNEEIGQALELKTDKGI